IELGNITLLQNFLGGLDEEWFVLVHVDIEAKAGKALAAVAQALRAARADNPDEVMLCLHAVAGAEEQMHHPLRRLPELCRPYLPEMRDYMPPKHRAFIETVEGLNDASGKALLYGYVRERRERHPKLWEAFRDCVRLLARFRETHLDYADRYIHQQHQRSASNPTGVGTGGTPFMTYLKKHLEETERFLDG